MSKTRPLYMIGRWICRLLLASGFVALSLVPVSATAQTRAAYDADGDRRVTPAEFRAARLNEILRLDSDGDGRVVRAETRTAERLARTLGGRAVATRLETLWEDADANRDGAISRAEAAVIADKRFPLYDLNHDGVLAGDEIAAAQRGDPRRR